MDLGIGIPSAVPGASAADVLQSATYAEELGFFSVGTIDRLVFDNYEPLVTLAAVAAVTSRIRLATAVLIAPYRANAALLAKQAATVDALSAGRLTLGMALGARLDDYEASGVPTEGRGDRFDAMLEDMGKVWAGESMGTAGAVGPRLANDRPKIIFGGNADAAFRRAAQHGDGWIAGGGTADGFEASVEKMQVAWSEHGRAGAPHMMAMAYCALGPNARRDADEWVQSYYGFAGQYADTIARRVATNESAVGALVSRYAKAGCQELILFPCSSDPAQVNLLAEALP